LPRPGRFRNDRGVTREQPTDGRAGVTAELVARLVADQFPRWVHLPVEPVPVDGWDNRTYRLGADMTVRLPTHASYVAAIEKEDRWLPMLAPQLPVPIPTPLATGAPGVGYPFPWSVRQWLPGDTARHHGVESLPGFAASVAEFILALQRVDPDGGPRAGAHSFYRGTPPAHYDDETRRALAALVGVIDVDRATAVWDAALDATWSGAPLWFHGDIAAGNLLVRDGALSAVIDFGTSGVGDPACDLVIAWTFFAAESRREFARQVNADAGTWARARGWALWKAMITLAGDLERDPAAAEANRALIADLLDDPVVS
jgi:aminoglycoside phosphotransferase (APT) family kinase protein